MTLAFDLPAPVPSRLGGLDPRWKLAAVLLATAAVAVLQTLPAAAVGCALVLGLALLGGLPAAWVTARLGRVLPFFVLFAAWLPFLAGGPDRMLGPVPVSGHGLALAGLVCLKGLTVVTLVLVLYATTPLYTTLHAAHALRVPGFLVQTVLLTYRYLFVLAAELARVRVALRVRGFRNRAGRHAYRTVGHVAGALLVRSAERAERVGQAMRCRGFEGRFRSAAVFRTGAVDVAFFVLVAGGAAGLAAWDLLRR